VTARELRDVSAQAAPSASRKRILDAAFELIARYGIAGMSLKLLADHVGLHKSTLFHHFSDKRELVEEVSVRFMAEIVGRVTALESDDPPNLERFVTIALELDDYFAAHPLHALFVMREMLGPFDPTWGGEQSAQTRRFFGVLADWLVRAREAGAGRPLSVPQTIVNLIAMSLFYPALADQFGDDFAVGAARSDEVRRRRRRELRETLLRALSP